jgi:transcriptional regulator with XRE-family HTH domain
MYGPDGRFRPDDLPRGIQARLARRLRVTAGAVSRVWRGESKSARIERAIQKELKAAAARQERRAA